MRLLLVSVCMASLLNGCGGVTESQASNSRALASVFFQPDPVILRIHENVL